MGQDLDSVILESVKTSLLDSALRSEEKLRPKIVYNDVSSGKDVRSVLIDELESCESYDFSVAFITKDGIASIAQPLLSEGRKGRILTTDYQAFNDPEMFRYLLDHQGGFEVRVCSDLHTKGYIFHNPDGGDTMLIGSSNLTQYALKQNHEWNLRITSAEDGELLRDTEREFRRLWDSAHELTEEWISEYEETFRREKARRIQETRLHNDKRIVPNSMQADALETLEELRSEGKTRALVIAATGTGKTYLSAFDVHRFRPARMLFLVHRENILDDAIETYRDVIGSGATYGKFTGSEKTDGEYMFASVQSMSRHLDEFPSNHFDYIVCDEVHHLVPRADDNADDRAVRNMYGRIISHFRPRFMLGMTATPERTDGANIYQVFDYNIAQEVRLKDALEADLLCPFHYFGISDVTVDGESLEDKSDFSRLVSDERVRHIAETVEAYPHSGRLHKGLMFCSRVEECRELSAKLNLMGYRTLPLSAENDAAEREEAVRRLQSDGDDHLDFILTRDIFNEGVDIPKVNEIVLLRPTQSVIVYIQQLGRGLRKAEGKEFLTVLDFIGNYDNNYMIPVALYGDNSCNQDNVRREMILNTVPGVSSVSFDRVTRERIFESIGTNRIKSAAVLRNKYMDLANKLGRAPTLCDLYGQDSIDPRVVVDQFGSLNAIRLKAKRGGIGLDVDQDSLLMFLSAYLVNGKRPYECAAVSDLLENAVTDRDRICQRVRGEYGIEPDPMAADSALNILSDGYLTQNEEKKYGHDRVAEERGGRFRTSDRFARFILDGERRELVKDIADCSSMIFRQEYLENYDGMFSLYGKYSRADVCRLANNPSNWYSTMYGYKELKHRICPIFVNYNKDDTLNSAVKYEEGFKDRYTFRWSTRVIRASYDIGGRMATDNDSLEARILDADSEGLRLPLFVKKGVSDTSDFYYLGMAHPVPDSDRVVRMADDRGAMKPVMTVELRLERPVDEKIYRYLTAPIESS